ncbi:MAG: DUF2799 domain-containing protein [Bdellovibrionales bacterium]
MKLFLLAIAAVGLTGCASYLKKVECNNTDWYKYGNSKAMNGERLTNDGFIGKCEEVEASVNHAALDQGFKVGMDEYCKTTTSYMKGKDGKSYNFDFCASNKVAKLKSKFNAGRVSMCKKDGYKWGSENKSYEGQCERYPKLEASFMTNFNKGRYNYLGTEIKLAQKRIRDIDYEVRRERDDLDSLNRRLRYLPEATRYVKVRKYDEFARRYVTKTEAQQDDSIISEKNELNRKIDSAESKIRSLREEQDNLRIKAESMTAERSRMQL